MTMLRLVTAVLVGVAALLLAPAPASAAPILFDFSDCALITPPLGPACPNTDSGKTTLTYMNGGLSITTYGFHLGPTQPTKLFVKQGGVAEDGLGITAETHHEIDANYLINLDVANLFSHGFTSGVLQLGSVQTGENYQVCIGPTAGQEGAIKCQTGSGGNIVALTVSGWDSTNHFIGITSPPGQGGADVLPYKLSVESSAVPEPTTMALFGTGVGGLVMMRRRSGGRIRS